MDIKKKKIIYILMAFAAALLLLCRHIYMKYPAMEWTNNSLLSPIAAEFIVLGCSIILIICFLCLNEDYSENYYKFLLLCGSLMYALCYAYLIFAAYHTSMKHNFYEINLSILSDKVRQILPFIGIGPVAMVYFLQEDKNSKKSVIITSAIMAAFAVASSLFAQALTGVYAMLAVMTILFAIDSAEHQKYNGYYTASVVLTAIICTILSFIVSRCTSVEHFVIAQYENLTSYIEGGWNSAAIFDGRLREAIGTCGLLSGSQTELIALFAGSYGTPVNVLLAYGWLPFILQLILSIIIAAGCYVIVWNITDKNLKRLGLLIAVWITVSTVWAYFLFPRMKAPLSLIIRSADVNLMWLILLIAIAVKDQHDRKKLEKTAQEKESDEK